MRPFSTERIGQLVKKLDPVVWLLAGKPVTDSLFGDLLATLLSVCGGNTPQRSRRTRLR